MIFISFYTKNTGYEKEVNNLIQSLKKFDLKYDIVGIKSLGSWRKNCNYKTTFIREMMDKYEKIDDRIIWLDADAVIQQYPALFEEIKEDIGVHYLKHKVARPIELLSGTIFVRINERTKRLFDKWMKELIKKPNQCSQRILQSFIKDMGVSIYNLPGSYTRIFDLKVQEDISPVIEHFQASRRFKHKVNKNIK